MRCFFYLYNCLDNVFSFVSVIFFKIIYVAIFYIGISFGNICMNMIYPLCNILFM